MRRSVMVGFGMGAAAGYWAGRRRQDGQPAVRSLVRKVSPSVRRQADLILADPEDAAVVIARDHDRLTGLLAEVRRAPLDRPEDQRRARALMQRLVAQAAAHEVVEELHVWPAVRDLVAGGTALSDAGAEQELELKRVLHTLDGRRPGDADFEALIARFAELSAAHMAFEEHEVWPQLQAVLRRRDRVRLGRTLVKAKKRAPTRPHPSDFADPAKHPLLVQSVGVVDRGLDRLTDRGASS